MSKWRPIGIHDIATSIDWNDAKQLINCDPYLIWADLNATVREGSKSRISLLVEVAPDFDWDHEDILGVTQLPWLANRVPDQSAIVPCVVNDIGALAKVVARVGRDVLRFTLCRPRTDIGWTSIRRQVERIKEQLGQPSPVPLAAALGGKLLVAILDDGCAFLNERLRRPAQDAAPPRQISLLDQDRAAPVPGEPYWTKPVFPLVYVPMPAPMPPIVITLAWEGSHLNGTAINNLRGAIAALRRNEADGYRAAGYLHPTPDWTHGQVVLDVAVGSPDPLGPLPRPSPGALADFIFVQLPRATVADTSGGSLDSHALDAMFYAALQAGAVEWHAKLVTNLSYGVYGKPHDGTSLFERAVVRLLDSPVGSRMELVLPAGNSHLLRTHAGGTLPANRVLPPKLRWHVPADCTCESTMQIWLPLSNNVEVNITAPDGSGPFQLLPGQARIWKPGAELRCAAVHAPSVADSRGLTMVFIGVSPTRRLANPAASALTILGGNTAPSVGWAPPGVWTIELVNADAHDARFDARIERGGSAPGLGDRHGDSGRRQSYFVEESRSPETPRGTLNGIATAPHARIHVVGAMQAQDEQLSRYSAAGPVYRVDLSTHPATTHPDPRGPTKVTVGDRSRHTPGVRAAGCRTRAIAEVDGTSIAAAAYTRLRARELSGGAPPIPATQPLTTRPFECPEESLEAPANLRGGGVRFRS